MYSLGVVTNRDDWAWDFSAIHLNEKMNAFITKYQQEMNRFKRELPALNQIGDWVDRTIKWTSELEAHLSKGDTLEFNPIRMTNALFRPFVAKQCYYAPIVTHRRYQMPHIFPHERLADNRLVCFSLRNKSPYVLASDRLVDLHFTGDTQCLPLYRYRDDGKRVSNITEWGLRQFRELYGDDSISAEAIFAYTYAVLHDPVYRDNYAIDLLREFPRLPFYDDFGTWVEIGQELLDLHIGFESEEPYPLYQKDKAGDAKRTILHANKERGFITLDDKTVLTGVPEIAWKYKLGSRSAIEWVLDQYKERKPRDPTIAERFNTYRFADYKERVIDLLGRVCTVSVRTMELIDSMPNRSCPSAVKS